MATKEKEVWAKQICNHIIFWGHKSLENDDAYQNFFENLMLYLCKGYKPFSTCENMWLYKLVLHQCPHVVLPSHFALVEQLILTMLNKAMDLHVLPNFASTTTMTTNFDL